MVKKKRSSEYQNKTWFEVGGLPMVRGKKDPSSYPHLPYTLFFLIQARE